MPDTRSLQEKMIQALKDLATPEGINASSRKEIYGCFFGRDGAITAIEIIAANKLTSNPELMEIAKRTLLTMVHLQGKEVNIESGEEPGKFIHEYRTEGYEHLVQPPSNWYLYPNKTVRNYDSLDATPLGLIAIYRYWEATGDDEFLKLCQSAIVSGLEWMRRRGDIDEDHLLEFTVNPERKHGGLSVHSWADSRESFITPAGTMPKYPIAPVEVQAEAWLAYKLWGQDEEAHKLKVAFNSHFWYQDGDQYFLAQGLDGDKNQIKTVTGHPLICLWASLDTSTGPESIIAPEYLGGLVKRGFADDLFDPEAGIRTMSTQSPTYNGEVDSYHNGSFWPMLNGLIYRGLLNFGFTGEAEKLLAAALKPIDFFECPIELYIHNDESYSPYLSPNGQHGCREQAWSAAALYSMSAAASSMAEAAEPQTGTLVTQQ